MPTDNQNSPAAPGTAGLSPLQAARSNLSNLSTAGLNAASVPGPAVSPQVAATNPASIPVPTPPASAASTLPNAAPTAGMQMPAAPVMTPSASVAPAMPATPTPVSMSAPVSPMPAPSPVVPAASPAPSSVGPASSMSASPVNVSENQPTPVTLDPQPVRAPVASASPILASNTPVAAPVIPSVAPRAPGAEIKPPQPIDQASAPADKKEKKVDVVMIVLLVILAVLVGVAAYLWWMNAQGKSIFSPKTADVQPVAVEEPAPVADASASSNIGGGFDENDICYVDPNLDGKQEKVQDFVQWVNESFTDVADGDGNYAWLFDYFIDRAAMTADLCHTHQQYCHVNFEAEPKYAAQFTHFNQQRELEAQGLPVQYDAYVAEADLQRLMMVDFNMDSVQFSDPAMGENSMAPNGWVYSNAAGGLMAFGAYEPVAPEYSYHFSKAMRLDATGQVVLVGEGVATSSCKESNNCVCEASRIYLLLEMGNTDNLYFQDVFVEPLPGQFAPVQLGTQDTNLYY